MVLFSRLKETHPQLKTALWSMPLIVTLETCHGPNKGFSDIYLSTLICKSYTLQGFPVGTKVDEQDPACVPNAKYTLGEFSVSGTPVLFAPFYYYYYFLYAI